MPSATRQRSRSNPAARSPLPQADVMAASAASGDSVAACFSFAKAFPPRFGHTDDFESADGSGSTNDGAPLFLFNPWIISLIFMQQVLHIKI